MTAPLYRYFIVRPDILEISKTQDLESTEFPVLTDDMVKLKGKILQFAYTIDHIIYLQDFCGSNDIDGFHPSWVQECRYFRVKDNAKKLQEQDRDIGWTKQMDNIIGHVGAYNPHHIGNCQMTKVIYFGREKWHFLNESLEEVFLKNHENQDEALSPNDLPKSGSWPKIVAVLEPDKLPIPRMVWVRQHNGTPWRPQELLADLSGMGLEHPYICRSGDNDEYTTPWKYMQEIPTPTEPEMRPITPRELLYAIKGGAVWRYQGSESVYAYWHSGMENRTPKELCFDWYGDEKDVWVKAEVKIGQSDQA